MRLLGIAAKILALERRLPFAIFKLGKYTLGNDYDYSVLEGIDLHLITSKEQLLNKSKVYIATAWETAKLVHESAEKDQVLGWYLIQNSEDDPSFSGNLSSLAEDTYELPLQKFVINRKAYEHFSKDGCKLFNVCINHSDFFQDFSIERKNIISTVLRKDKSKGAEYAIEALNMLHSRNEELEFVAYGDYPTTRVPPWIKFYHKPINSILRTIYNSSQIFVLPSLVEGFPVPPLEAMACGAAVVATRNGGCEEYIIDGVNGLLCNIKDSKNLALKVEYLIDNKEILMGIQKEGLATSMKFSYESMCTGFLNIVSELINK